MEVGANNTMGGQESENETHTVGAPTEGMLRALKNKSNIHCNLLYPPSPSNFLLNSVACDHLVFRLLFGISVKGTMLHVWVERVYVEVG